MRQSLSIGLCAVLLGACSSMPPSKTQLPNGARIDPAGSTLTADQTTGVLADGNTTVRLTTTVVDTNGKRAAGVRVSWSVTGTGNTVSEPSATDPNGEAFGYVRSTRAEAKTVTTTLDVDGMAVALSPLTLTFVPGPASDLVFTVQPSATKAGAVMTPPVKVSVLDRGGNLTTENVSVSVRLVRSNSGTLTGGAAVMTVNGVATFDALSVNRPQVGRALRAEMSNGAAAESALFDITPGDVSAATSTLLGAPVNVVADGVAVSTLTVTARDLGGNVLPAQPVSLTVSGTGNTVGALTGVTDASGVFTTTLASTVAETKTVAATVGGVRLMTTVTFFP